MTRTFPALHWLVLVTVIVSAAGCQKNAKEREAKRESDRMAMQLQDCERERNQSKAQVEELKANLDTAVNRSRAAQNDLTAAQTQLKQAQDQLAKSQSNASDAAELQRKLSDLQLKNEQLMADTKSLQQQLAAAKTDTARTTPVPASSPPSTQPSMNK